MPRHAYIQVRVSPEEKALVEAAAAADGLKASEYIRREVGIGKFRREALMGLRREPAVEAEEPAGRGSQATRPQRREDFEARVEELMRTMPRRNAEVLARREMGKS